MKLSNKFKKIDAFTLIEIMLTIAFFCTFAVAISQIYFSSLNAEKKNQNRFQAFLAASSKIEELMLEEGNQSGETQYNKKLQLQWDKTEDAISVTAKWYGLGGKEESLILEK